MGAVLSLPYFRLGRLRRASPAVLPPSPAQSQRTLVISHPRPLAAASLAASAASPDTLLRSTSSVRRARPRTPSRRASARFKAYPYDRDARHHPERQLSLRSAGSRAGRGERRPRPRSYPPLLGDGLPRLREEPAASLGLHLFDDDDDDDGGDDDKRPSSDESHESATVSTTTATTLSALEFLAGPALCTTAAALDPLNSAPRKKKKRRAVLTKHRTIEGGWDWVRAEDLSGWSSA
ncbi:uncharacterized protein LOC62_04G005809 [Vanrija pseudolonga]|uniref:Uncharacterized protein n=1 Tax=Vanrija pseudolonga TaxID=143232 RepID=A0AAF1BIH7_9TREE|nr:hypothetical protein LOC62_04G005809 [Vanrija pseudolonga]